ncbi:MAG: hypothetical protein ACYTKD_07055 [Planctomycetota bacterium]
MDENTGRKSPLRMDGLHFDTANWDGSDFFTLEDADFCIVVRGVVEALREAEFTGWEARPVTEISF